jgi:sigma-B regulation protein RsbU (phosphoserine phosphatase)
MLPKESALLVYTDGLTEAENSKCELLGNERVLEDLSHLDCLSARNIVERMTKLVTGFAGEAQQSDDLTLLCVRLTNNI